MARSRRWVPALGMLIRSTFGAPGFEARRVTLAGETPNRSSVHAESGTDARSCVSLPTSGPAYRPNRSATDLGNV